MQKNFTFYDDRNYEANIKTLAEKLNITPFVATILCHRGILTVKAAEEFLNPEFNQKFNDPFLMKDMDKAVDRIQQAIKNNEKIAVYGDYDVDGMTASALMLKTLKKFGVTAKSYIPDRQNEGYGFNVPALKKIVDEGVNLLISVDCGISNVKEIEEVRDRLDVIVTDHHLPSGEIDNAIAVLDPHQLDCKYPDKNLCGVGVAFKLCQALHSKINRIDIQNYIDDLDLVALGTIADIVPLIGENRKIVRIGLKQMADTNNMGLRALIKSAGIDSKKISTGQVGFRIAPRLNSIGRLDTASEGVKLLITEDESEAQDLANKLELENTERKNKELQILRAAYQKVQDLFKEKAGDISSIVVAGEGWHPGIIGLTASKLVEKYYLPTIVIAIQGDIARGSCRSIEALHIKNALDHFKDYFIQYGGHSAAAGFSIHTKDVENFSREFDTYVKNSLKEKDFIMNQKVDILIHPSKMTVKLASEIENLEPFGIGNPAPVFACKSIKGKSAKTVGKDKNHLSFYIESNDSQDKAGIRAIAWNASQFSLLVENELIDITYSPDLNEYNDTISVQCTVNSLEASKENGLFPTYEVMVNIYRFLKQYSDETNFQPYDICKMNVNFKNSPFASKNSKFNSIYTMLCAVQIFKELGLILFDLEEKNFCMPKPDKKLELNQSRFWRINNK